MEQRCLQLGAADGMGCLLLEECSNGKEQRASTPGRTSQHREGDVYWWKRPAGFGVTLINLGCTIGQTILLFIRTCSYTNLYRKHGQDHLFMHISYVMFETTAHRSCMATINYIYYVKIRFGSTIFCGWSD